MPPTIIGQIRVSWGVKCETLLDGGAGVNSWAEEIVVGAINVAMAKGIQPSDPRFSVVQLEK